MEKKRATIAATGPGSKRARSSKAAGRSSGSKASSATGSAAADGPTDIEELATFTEEELSAIRSNLLDWYDANHRVLPWRRNPRSRLGPEVLAAAAAAGVAPAPTDLPLNEFIYYEWVSEVMCQQTQISRAADYFQRWVARWPTVAALAAASQEEVNEAWAGLGYYRRARYLLEGARYVVNELGGTFPRTAKELQKIPGVGGYTGAAIASIACGERTAVVDGNVIRVLARLRRLSGDPRSGATARALAAAADALVDPERPGDFNQAVMELGATVCVPNTEPRCGDCPVAGACSALAAQRGHAAAGGDPGAGPRVTDYPTKVEKAAKREETVAVTVLQLLPPGAGDCAAPGLDDGAFLLVQRPEGGLLAGLWEFPSQVAAAPAAAGKGGGGGGGGGDDGGGGAAAASPAALQSQMAGFLSRLLGVRLLPPGGGGGGAGAAPEAGCPGGSALLPPWEVVERRPLGSLVHVFSHIRQTMVVEKLVARGELPPDAGGSGGGGGGDGRRRPATQWLSRGELEARGLSSGTAKVLKLLLKDAASRGKKGGSITKFFKPLAKQHEAP